MSDKKIPTGGALLIASDIHGNTSQYDKLFSYALNHDCSGIILCGDITPKGLLFNASGQRAFLTDYLFARLDSLHRQRGKPLPVFLMMGNDDLKTNEPLLIESQMRHHFTYIHNRIVPFGNYFIAGYSFVPPTPHKCKDWEKSDGAKIAADRGVSRDDGWVSRGEERVPCFIGGVTSIARDLQHMFKGFTHFDKTIFVSHAPPYGSHLDMVRKDRQHVGSMAIREFLSRNRPMLSVHGHIHETVSVSGQWHDRVHDAAGLSLALGNDHHDASPQVILAKLSKSGPAIQRTQITAPEHAYSGAMNMASLLSHTLITQTSRSMQRLTRKIAGKLAQAGGFSAR